MLAYCGICWHIVTHMNVDISWLMNMLTPIGVSVGVKLPNELRSLLTLINVNCSCFGECVCEFR